MMWSMAVNTTKLTSAVIHLRLSLDSYSTEMRQTFATWNEEHEEDRVGMAQLRADKMF